MIVQGVSRGQRAAMMILATALLLLSPTPSTVWFAVEWLANLAASVALWCVVWASMRAAHDVPPNTSTIIRPEHS